MNILVLYLKDRTFVRQDIDLLSKDFVVTPFQFKFRSIPRLIKEIKKNDKLYIWFASYHAFVATILTKKPKIVVAGGYDVANVPEKLYGLASNPITRAMVRYTLRRASKIIAVSKNTQNEVLRNFSLQSTLVYNSVDTNKFTPFGRKKRKMILTVGYVDEVSWERKGLDKFVALAREAQEKKEKFAFIVVGEVSPEMKKKAQKMQNEIGPILFTGRVSEPTLLRLYQESKVYCQLSYHEAFGVSVAEAMACECIPVVTNCAALPEVVGDTGIVTDEPSLSTIKKAVRMSGKKARERVVERFSLEKRSLKECVQ